MSRAYRNRGCGLYPPVPGAAWPIPGVAPDTHSAYPPQHEDVVGAGRGDLERPLRRRLRLYVRKIDVAHRHLAHQRGRIGAHRAQFGAARQVLAHRRQRRSAAHRDSIDDRGLGDIGLRKDQCIAFHRARGERNRQGATNRTQVAFEPEFSKKQRARHPVVGDLSARDQNPDGDGQVECAAALRHVGRREVDGDASQRQLVTRVAERRRDAFAPFLDRAEWQADRRERRQAIGDVDLDVDGQRVNTDDGSGPDAGKQKRPRRRSRVDADRAPRQCRFVRAQKVIVGRGMNRSVRGETSEVKRMIRRTFHRSPFTFHPSPFTGHVSPLRQRDPEHRQPLARAVNQLGFLRHDQLLIDVGPRLQRPVGPQDNPAGVKRVHVGDLL